MHVFSEYTFPSAFHAGFFFGLFFVHEDGGELFLQNSTDFH
jgi:hypothetical protein